MRRFLIVILLLISVAAWGDSPQMRNTNPAELVNATPLTFRMDYQPVFQSGESTLGLVGLHALARDHLGLYGGLGMYGAVHGDYGGLFTLGLDAGIQRPIYGPIWLDVGSYVGGGGGHDADVGDGGVVAPHAGFALHTHNLILGLSYSYFKFIDNGIQSNTVMLSLGVPFSIPQVNTGTNQSLTWRYDDLKEPQKLSFKHDYIAISGGANKPKNGAKNTANEIDDDYFGLLGFAYGHYFGSHFYMYGRVQGAFHNDAGYQDVFLGSGYDWRLASNWSVQTKLGLGAGGGGKVNTGGGFLIHPQLGIEYRILPQLGVALDGGYVVDPETEYDATSAHLNFKYYLNLASVRGNGVSADNFDTFVTESWRLGVANQTLVSPKRTDDKGEHDVNLFSLHLDYLLNPYVYLSGQSGYAYSGDAGAFGMGMLGLGAQTGMMLDTFRLYGAVYAGAAGGGGIDSGDGFVTRPEVGLSIPVSLHTNIKASYGRTIASDNGLNANTLQAGLTYHFQTLLGR